MKGIVVDGASSCDMEAQGKNVYLYPEVYNSLSGVVSTSNNGEKIYSIMDHLGSVRCTIKQSGDRQYFDYKPFGEDMYESTHRIGFGGQEFNSETPYYAMGARWYDAKLGRFLSIDPLFEYFPEQNGYHYCHNSPLNWCDPSGMDELNEQYRSKVEGSYCIYILIDVGEGWEAWESWMPLSSPLAPGSRQKRFLGSGRSSGGGFGQNYNRSLWEKIIGDNPGCVESGGKGHRQDNLYGFVDYLNRLDGGGGINLFPDAPTGKSTIINSYNMNLTQIYKNSISICNMNLKIIDAQTTNETQSTIIGDWVRSLIPAVYFDLVPSNRGFTPGPFMVLSNEGHGINLISHEGGHAIQFTFSCFTFGPVIGTSAYYSMIVVPSLTTYLFSELTGNNAIHDNNPVETLANQLWFMLTGEKWKSNILLQDQIQNVYNNFIQWLNENPFFITGGR